MKSVFASSWTANGHRDECQQRNRSTFFVRLRVLRG
jgi:hypothetical protein